MTPRGKRRPWTQIEREIIEDDWILEEWETRPDLWPRFRTIRNYRKWVRRIPMLGSGEVGSFVRVKFGKED